MDDEADLQYLLEKLANGEMNTTGINVSVGVGTTKNTMMNTIGYGGVSANTSQLLNKPRDGVKQMFHAVNHFLSFKKQPLAIQIISFAIIVFLMAFTIHCVMLANSFHELRSSLLKTDKRFNPEIITLAPIIPHKELLSEEKFKLLITKKPEFEIDFYKQKFKALCKDSQDKDAINTFEFIESNDATSLNNTERLKYARLLLYAKAPNSKIEDAINNIDNSKISDENKTEKAVLLSYLYTRKTHFVKENNDNL